MLKRDSEENYTAAQIKAADYLYDITKELATLAAQHSLYVAAKCLEIAAVEAYRIKRSGKAEGHSGNPRKAYRAGKDRKGARLRKRRSADPVRAS